MPEALTDTNTLLVLACFAGAVLLLFVLVFRSSDSRPAAPGPRPGATRARGGRGSLRPAARKGTKPAPRKERLREDAAAPLARMERVTREYRTESGPAVVALQDVSLEVAPGEMLGIIGPSGQGKSTLLNILGGIDFPTRGRVFFDGREVAREEGEAIREFRANNVSFIFQDLNLVSHLSALENAALPLICRGESRSGALAHARTHLVALGLEAELSRKPAQLSGGQQQRVAIARALASRAVLILADEPTGSLDPVTADEVMNAFGELSGEEGRTVVLVSHNTALAQRYCTRLLECTNEGLREVWRRGEESPVHEPIHAPGGKGKGVPA